MTFGAKNRMVPGKLAEVVTLAAFILLGEFGGLGLRRDAHLGQRNMVL